MMRNYTKYMHKSFAEAIPNLQSENMTLKLQKFGMCCSHGNQTRLEKSRQTHADISKMAEESFHIFKLSEKLTIVFWSVRIRFLVKQYLFQIFNNLKSSFQLFMFIIFWQQCQQPSYLQRPNNLCVVYLARFRNCFTAFFFIKKLSCAGHSSAKEN